MIDSKKVFTNNEIAANLSYYCGTDSIKKPAAKRSVGRPISTGVGKKITIYLPNKSLDLLDRISRDWSGSRSDIIQEAIARYAADLDGAIQEGEKSYNEYTSSLDPCSGCDDYDGFGGCISKGGCGSMKGDSDNG